MGILEQVLKYLASYWEMKVQPIEFDRVQLAMDKAYNFLRRVLLMVQVPQPRHQGWFFATILNRTLTQTTRTARAKFK